MLARRPTMHAMHAWQAFSLARIAQNPLSLRAWPHFFAPHPRIAQGHPAHAPAAPQLSRLPPSSYPLCPRVRARRPVADESKKRKMKASMMIGALCGSASALQLGASRVGTIKMMPAIGDSGVEFENVRPPYPRFSHL